MLKCWNWKFLFFVNVGICKFQKFVILKCWNFKMLKFGNVEIWKCWTISKFVKFEIVKFQTFEMLDILFLCFSYYFILFSFVWCVSICRIISNLWITLFFKVYFLIKKYFQAKSFPRKRTRKHIPWAHFSKTFRIECELKNTNARSHT